ncbi:hypothetical protein SESBI_26358 [Sesbania bispinosa]|nr:hypothetical protein SESBI_26358 [Sesbania bispinosa]
MEEVQVNTSQAIECNATEPRRNIRIVVVGNEFEKIVELRKLMTKEDRDAFSRRYGRILDLLVVKYEENGANPIPAILADTFLSMMVCHQKKEGL